MDHQSKKKEFLSAYDQWSDAIERHCYFRVFSREKAEDLTQETFKKTWMYILQGKEIENMKAFLYRVANNLIIDESRKKTTISLDQLQGEGEDEDGESALIDRLQDPKHTEEALMGRMDSQWVHTALSKLDEKQREVLTLRYLDGFDPREIAEMTGENPNTVSVHLYRAIQKLRTFMV